MNSPIFTVTSVQESNKHEGSESSRCWGWYPTYKDASEAVKLNDGDMHECSYTYIVIERIPWGTLGSSYPNYKIMQWFKWKNNKWKKCKPPKWSNCVIGWAF